MKNAPETQMTLIVRLKAAEEAAWRDFVEIYEPAVYGRKGCNMPMPSMSHKR